MPHQGEVGIITWHVSIGVLDLEDVDSCTGGEERVEMLVVTMLVFGS